MTMSPAKELADKYRSEFEETYDGLRKYSLELSENLQQRLQQLNENWHTIQPQVVQQSDEVLKSLQNVEPVQASVNNKLLPTFAWISVMQLAALAASVASSYLLFPLVGLTLGVFWSVVLAYALLPVLAYSHLANVADDERTARYKLLAFAAVEGLLTGYLYSYRYLSTIQPLAFLTPLAVAGVALQAATFLGENPSRTGLLGACLGGGLAAHFGVGLVLGQLSFSYLLLSLLYTGVAYCAIQLYLKYQEKPENVPVNLDQLCMLGYVVGALLCQGLVFSLFGGPKPLNE